MKIGMKVNGMSDIDDLDTCICDWSYKEGLEEIIKNLETITIDTRAMNESSHCVLYGQELMLKKIIEYLKKCL